jgi:hypothetical protein
MNDPIFVFGSNLLGIHGGGAAKFARDQRGAVRGVGVGLQGNSYAIPTCWRPGQAMALQFIDPYVDQFKVFARFWHPGGSSTPIPKYLLTRVGCGIAGFRDDEIAPMFNGSPYNVIMPIQWKGMVNAVSYHDEGKILVP